MTDARLDTVIPATSDTGLARRPALFNDSATGADCPPCDELARIRAALVEMRRGMVSLERGLAALLAAVESSADHGRLDP